MTIDDDGWRHIAFVADGGLSGSTADVSAGSTSNATGITIGRMTGTIAGDGFLIAEKRALWWDPRRETGDASWGSHVVLSERFFKEATEAPVPLDLRVLRALRSPFEIDIYV